MIRLATTRDAKALQKIYAPYVTDTATSFEITPPSVKEMKKRIEITLPYYPFLVYEEDGEIAGYAYASPFRQREAYRYSTSASIYLSPDFHSKGIGSKLYEVLFEILRRQNYLTCLVAITLPNDKSHRLHQKFGFSEVGTHHKVGYKCGKWQDVLWLEKSLSTYPEEPFPIKIMQEVDFSDLL